MYSRAFVKVQLRLALHGDHFKRAHGFKIAQAAVRHRADASRPSAKKTAQRCLHDGAWIAAQLPSARARFSFEHAETHAGFADGHTAIGDVFYAFHAREVENDASVQRNGLTIIPRASATWSNRNIVRIAEA